MSKNYFELLKGVTIGGSCPGNPKRVTRLRTSCTGARDSLVYSGGKEVLSLHCPRQHLPNRLQLQGTRTEKERR